MLNYQLKLGWRLVGALSYVVGVLLPLLVAVSQARNGIAGRASPCDESIGAKAGNSVLFSIMYHFNLLLSAEELRTAHTSAVENV